MTAPTTSATPVYGIKYPVPGAPIRGTRQLLQDNANTVEAALIRGGIAPPSAQDLATLAGRVAKLENRPLAQLRQTNAQTGLAAAAWVAITFSVADKDTASGFAPATNVTRWTCPASEAGTYMVGGQVVFGAMANGSQINARVLKSGAVLPGASGTNGLFGGPAGAAASVSPVLIDLAAGDYLQLGGFCGVAWATAVFPDAASHITIARVR